MRKTLTGIVLLSMFFISCSRNYESRVMIGNSQDKNWVNQESSLSSPLSISEIINSVLMQCPNCGYDIYNGLMNQNYLIVLSYDRGFSADDDDLGVSIGFTDEIPIMEHKIGTASYGQDEVITTWHSTTIAWPQNSYVLNIDDKYNFKGETSPLDRSGYFKDYYELKSFEVVSAKELLASYENMRK